MEPISGAEKLTHLFTLAGATRVEWSSFSSASWSLRENVAVKSVLTLDLSCASELEALLGSRFGLNFWHFFV
jgi:hypothetical protein